MLIVVIAGLFGTYYFYNKSITFKNETKVLEKNDLNNTKITFNEYAKLLENKDEHYAIINDFSVIDEIYLQNGNVYSFLTDQTGASAYPFFNEKDEINIKEETKFHNIIKFGNYLSTNNEYYFYGIDINGNIIYYKN